MVLWRRLEDELVVDVVSYKTLSTEVVVARTPSCGTTLRLPAIHTEALVRPLGAVRRCLRSNGRALASRP